MRGTSLFRSTLIATTCLAISAGVALAQASGGGAGGAGGAGAGAAGTGGLGAGGVGAGGVGSGGVGGVGGTVGGTSPAGGLGGTSIGTAPASGSLAIPGAVAPTGTVPGVVPGTGTATTTPGGGTPQPVVGTPLQPELPGLGPGRQVGSAGTNQTTPPRSNGATARQIRRSARFGAPGSARTGTNATGTNVTGSPTQATTTDPLATQLDSGTTATGQAITGRARTRARTGAALNQSNLQQGASRTQSAAGTSATTRTGAGQVANPSGTSPGPVGVNRIRPGTAPDIKNIVEPGAGTATTGIPTLDPSTNTLQTTNPAATRANDTGFEERNQDPSLSNDFSNPAGPLFNDQTGTATTETAQTGSTVDQPGQLGTATTTGTTGALQTDANATTTPNPTQVTTGFRGTNVTGTQNPTLSTTTTNPTTLNTSINTLQTSLGLQFSTTGNALTISQVTPGTVAALAGLQAGDQIVGINGQNVQTAQTLLTQLRNLNAADQATLNVMRNGQTVPITVDLSSIHALLGTDTLLPPGGGNIRGTFPPSQNGTTTVPPARNDSGARLQAGNGNARSMAAFSRLQTNLGLQFARVGNGLTVQRVTQGGQGALAGLQSGDQIVSLNGQTINSGRDLLTQLRALGGAEQATLMVQRGGQTIPIMLDLSTLQSLLTTGTATSAAATRFRTSDTGSTTNRTAPPRVVPRTPRPGSLNSNP